MRGDGTPGAWEAGATAVSPLCAACPLPSRLQQARRRRSRSVHLPPFPLCRRPGSGGAGSAAGAALSAGSTADACTGRDGRSAVAVCRCSFSAGLPVCRGAAGREHGAPRPASPAPSSLHHAAPFWASHPLALLAIWLKRCVAVEWLADEQPADSAVLWFHFNAASLARNFLQRCRAPLFDQ